MIHNRLLETAIDQFGRHGFDGTSTREIARASETAMSSITYHFGGKEGLYLAAADHIAASIREAQSGTHGAPEDCAPSRGEAVARVIGMLDGFATMMLDCQSESWARFMAREQQQPTEAFERLYRGAMKPMIETMLRLLEIARPDVSDRQRRAVVVMLIGQALVMRVGRASVCRILGVDELGEDERSLLRARLSASAQCILAGGA